MKIPIFKLLQLLFFEDAGLSGGGGESSPPAVVENPPADAPNGDGEQGEPEKEAAAPFTVPETDDDLAEVINTPHGQNIAQLRQHARTLDADLRTFKGEYEPWKPLVEQIGDPEQAKYYHETFSGLHQPVVDPNTNQPTGRYSSLSGLQRMEKEQPGIVDEIFSDLLVMRVPDESGKMDTLLNHLYRSNGLDPSRLDDYKNIDARTVNGLVTAEELAAVPPQYQAAYKRLPESLRGVWKDLSDSEKQYHLDTSKTALDTEELRQQIANRERQETENAQRELSARVEQKQLESLSTHTQTIYKSIRDNISSQIKFSEADEALNSAQLGGIMTKLYCAIDPAASFLVEDEFKAAGVNLDFPDAKWQEVIEAFTDADSQAVKLAEEGQIADARKARTKANGYQAKIVARLNSAGLALAERASGHIVTKSQIPGATARISPNGQAMSQNGNGNPYGDNPHPLGSPEYKAFNRSLDRQLGYGATAG